VAICAISSGWFETSCARTANAMMSSWVNSISWFFLFGMLGIFGVLGLFGRLGRGPISPRR
jgi:hypothetical protein